MDIGRPRLRVAAIAPLINEDTIQDAFADVYNSFQAIGKDMAVQAGRVNLLCSVAVVRGNALNISNSRFILADRTLSRPACAIAIGTAAAGTLCPAVLLSGYAAGFTGLSAGSTYYLGTAGAITTVKPGSGLIQPVGYALSATEMLINISQP